MIFDTNLANEGIPQRIVSMSNRRANNWPHLITLYRFNNL